MANKAKTTTEETEATTESGKSEAEYLAALDVQQKRIAELASYEGEVRALRETVEKQQAEIADLSHQVEVLSK